MAVNSQHGIDAEEAARAAAAVLGLPDFVFTVARLDKGRASREVGDGLLIANGQGAVVQVKARRPDAAGDPAGWLSKHGAKASRQGAGTRRSIRLAQETGSPLLATPVRTAGLGPEIESASGLRLDMDVSTWPTIVVVDHPAAAGWAPPNADCFWITLEDWHELWRALRSVTSVLTYVQRVVRARLVVPLGEEVSRFGAMRDADVADHGDAAWLTEDTYEDPLGAQLYRELVDRVWPNDRPLPTVPMADYRLIVNFLDSAAPRVLPQIGRWILSKRDEQQKRSKSGGLLLLDYERLLVYKAATWDGPASEERFEAELVVSALVRSAEATAQTGRFVPSLAVGHLVGPHHVDYRYAFIREPVAPTAAQRAVVLHEGGAFDLSKRVLVPIPEAPALAECPCGSGVSAGRCPDQLFNQPQKRRLEDPANAPGDAANER